MRTGRGDGRFGFTLMELMVVVVIIAVLLALMIPGLSRVRHHSRITQCAATLRGFTLVLNQFANDHHGQLPTGDASQNVAKPQNNLWDIPASMLDELTGRYDLKRKNTVCSELDLVAFMPIADATYLQKEAPKIQAVLGYGYWVPRLGTADDSGTTEFPPAADRSNPYYQYSPDPNVNPQQGPRTLTDPNGVRVPVLSDAVFADFDGNEGDPSYPKGTPSYAKGLDKFSTHVWSGEVDYQNRAFIDGRVERAKVGEIKPTYNLKYYSPYKFGGNYPSWNWQ